MSSFHDAVLKNDVNYAHHLIKSGQDPNSYFASETCSAVALITACYSGYHDMVKMLLREGAHVQVTDSLGRFFYLILDLR